MREEGSAEQNRALSRASVGRVCRKGPEDFAGASIKGTKESGDEAVVAVEMAACNR